MRIFLQKSFVFFLTLAFLGAMPALLPVAASEKYILYSPADFPTYAELKQLSENRHPSSALDEKLEHFFKTPVISNEAYYAGIKPHQPKDPRLGKFLRIISWNIEKSIHMPQVIEMLTNKNWIQTKLHPEKAPRDSAPFKNILRQRERLENADIFILQEMEVGLKRSHYLDATRELAKALNMNYAYAPQYLEIDPALLGTEKMLYENGAEDTDAQDYYREDPKKFKGVFGSAVLSRYPIKHVEIFPLKRQGYDWYTGEKNNISFLEKARRIGAKSTFKNDITREVKVGGRGYMRVDLDVPDLPDNTLTIINVHLEIKCEPKVRAEQTEEILSYIKNIKNPVVMMGDFNAAPSDISPTSVSRMVVRTAKDPTTWFSAAVSYVSPQGLLLNTTRTVSNVTKNFNDPFATDVKIIAPNPSKKMFANIRDFRFADGTVFDFRGDSNRSVNGKSEFLSNSNERGLKGFKTSFSFKRPIGIIGKYRLDWVFVKSGSLYSIEDKNAPYQFAPHFGETLEELNASLIEPLSDHHPNVIDIPFDEPQL